MRGDTLPVVMRILAFIVVALFLALGTWYLTRSDPIEVEVEAASLGDVEASVANTRAGTVRACRRARLSPALGGQIARLAVDEGDSVRAGDLLLELWNEDIKARLELAVREAGAAQARAEAVCVDAERAQRESRRIVRLHRQKAVSEEDADNAVLKARARRAECDAAQATAQVEQSRIRVTEAELTKTRLVAPFSGVVAEVTGEVNEYVTPSPPGIPTPPAIDLIDNTCFYVQAPVDEVDVARVQAGMPVWISLDAFGSQRFAGRVERIAPYVLDLAKQARTVDLDVIFLDDDVLDSLLAGYSADVEVVLEVRKGVLRIPTPAVSEDGRVFVLDGEQGVLGRRAVETGLSNWVYTEVLSGLEPGDLVVTSPGQEGVEDGARARPQTGYSDGR